MLFNYSHCVCCKKGMNNTKLTLHNILPVHICNKICEYNVYCDYFKLLVEDERKFSKLKQEEDVSNIELQIRFSYLFNKPPFEHKDVKNVKVSKMNALIDNIDVDDVKFKKAMKSYFKSMYSTFNKKIFPFVGKKKMLIENIFPWAEQVFPYYNCDYRDDMLLKFIIYEYLLALIGNDIDYMELKDIHKYLDEIFPNERLNDE